MLESFPILKEAVQTPGLLKEIYGDLAKPGVTQVGKALSTVLGLGNTILWPLALLNERAKISLDKNLESYRKQIEQIPNDKIIEVAPEVGVPIAEKLAYVSDDELSQLYINLLAKASTSETGQFAHPSFATVINNLCPDEAILLKELKAQPALPFLTAKFVNKPNGQWNLIGDLLTGTELKIHLAFPNNLVAYFSNLEGLGIIEVRRDIFLAKPELYKDLEGLYKPLCEAISYNPDTHRIEYDKGKIEITPFGNLFIRACLTKLNDV